MAVTASRYPSNLMPSSGRTSTKQPRGQPGNPGQFASKSGVQAETPQAPPVDLGATAGYGPTWLAERVDDGSREGMVHTIPIGSGYASEADALAAVAEDMAKVLRQQVAPDEVQVYHLDEDDMALVADDYEDAQEKWLYHNQARGSSWLIRLEGGSGEGSEHRAEGRWYN